MAKFNTLPDDILYLIYEHVVLSGQLHDAQSIISLGLVNRRLSSLTAEHLLRDVKFEIRFANGEFPQKFKRFVCTLEERPALAKFVRYIELRWWTGTSQDGEKESAVELANTLLVSLTNLKGLVLTVHRPEYGYRFIPRFLDVNPMTDLTRVEVFDEAMTFEDLMERYMRLLRVESITVRRMDRESPLPLSRLEVSGVSTLGLGGVSLTRNQLFAILQLPRSLRKLVCSFLDEKCSPNATTIHQALSPAQSSLTDLRLSGDDNQTPCDLRDFTVLKRLAATAPIFFLASHPGIERDGVYKLLPTSLDTLELEFPFHWWVFNNDDRHDRSDPASLRRASEDPPPWKYEWLRELAYYTHLKTLKVSERIKHRKGFLFKGFSWLPPPALQDAFDEADLDVEVWLRKDREDIEPCSDKEDDEDSGGNGAEDKKIGIVNKIIN
ncbi:MAG: hypothetical protein Q9211_001251 [Gyalolechia sp. 1 TL-2023]